MHTIVIGAGIVGASIACGLAETGAEVTLVDAAGPGAGATGRSFGWVNASFFADDAHFRLRQAALEAWGRLDPSLVDTRGCLWWEESGAELKGMGAQLRASGYEVERLDGAGVQRIAPALAQPPEEALFFPAEIAVDSLRAASWLAQQAARAGARVIHGATVDRIESAGGRVTGVHGPAGYLAADRVIVAAGTLSPALLEPLGVRLPMLRRPGLLLTTRPIDIRLQQRHGRAGAGVSPVARRADPRADKRRASRG
jgi:glycine/D-amino acid oxidase-like deaminating enzyme